MAKKRRRDADKLTPAQLEYLYQGYTVAARYFEDEPEPFENEDQARKAWKQHPDDVIAEFKRPTQGRCYQGRKPWAHSTFPTATQ